VWGKKRLKQRLLNDDDNNNSILDYLYAESTATGPITDTAQWRYK
jgi:hypothetical protein